jgi:uncharacterized protein (DUF433 family)
MHDDPYVSETPGVCGGYPVVRGTRIPVRILVAVYRESGDVDELLAMYPHLTREQVQGALDYYAKYPARVDEDFERHARVWAEYQGQPWPA